MPSPASTRRLVRRQLAKTTAAGGPDVVNAATLNIGGDQPYTIQSFEEVVDLTDADAVFVALETKVPAGAVILGVQANLDVAVVAAGNSARVGIGPSDGIVDFGVTTNKNVNQKITTIPKEDEAHVASEMTLRVNAVQADGSTAGTGAISAGSVRVRVTYATLAALPDA